MNRTYVLNNLKIIKSNEIIDHGHIIIRDKQIYKVNVGSYFGDIPTIDCTNLIAFPGFIDVHIHGSFGIDFMDANVRDYMSISESLYKEGVTTYLATTLTSDHDSLEKVCRTVAKAVKVTPSLLGIHLEGPYISKEKKGAQNELYIRSPDIKELKELYDASNGNIRYITLAPELKGALPFIQYASNLGITVSAGHTMATFKDIEKAIKCGLTNTTHTYNAMTGDDHRHPGVVNAAMYFDNIFPELICDKIHVSPDTIKTFYKVAGPNRLIVVTDSLKAKHTNISHFKLYKIDCEEKNGAVYTKNNVLAGSILTMDQALRNMYDLCDNNLVNLAKICSKNAAKSLHLDDRGEIKEGLLADIVLLDNNLTISKVFKLGKQVV